MPNLYKLKGSLPMKRVLLFLLIGGSLGALLTDDADARSYRRGGGGGYGGVQTPQSAAGHAMADIIRSQGMYNMATSRAMVNIQQARGAYLQNQKMWLEVMMQRKRAHQAMRAMESEAAHARAEHIQEYLAHKRPDAPPPLTSSQLDPTTGHITWPTVLQSESFSDHRSRIESMFAAKAHRGLSAEGPSQIQDAVREMQGELRNHIHDFATADYLESRKFLDSLTSSAVMH
jgi:predicted RNA-binding protein YlxR (DUF448 family)